MTQALHSPAWLGDHHLRPVLVELCPELLVLQRHLGVVLDVVLLGGRGPKPGPVSEVEPRQTGEKPGVSWKVGIVLTLSSWFLFAGRHPPDGVLKLFVGPRPGKWPGEKEPGWNGGWGGYPDTPDTPDIPISGRGSSGGGGKLVIVSQVGEGLMSSWHVTRHVGHWQMLLSRKSRVVTEQTQFDSDQAPDPICNCWCRIKGWKETGFKSENLK